MINYIGLKRDLLGTLHKSALTPVSTTYYSPKLGKMITRVIPKNLNKDTNTVIPWDATKASATALSSTLKLKGVPPTAKKVSQASKDKVKELSKLFKTDDEMLKAVESIGLNIGAFNKDWTTSYEKHHGIKVMRAKEALALHIEDGVNVEGAVHQYLKNNSIPTPANGHTLPNLLHKIKDAVVKAFTSITSTNMFFLGHSGFNTQNAVKGSMHQRWDAQLSKDEYKSINQYTRHSRDLNKWLRGLYQTSKKYGPTFWSMWGKHISEFDFFKRQTKCMDEAIDKYELDEDIVVYRAMDIGRDKQLENIILNCAKTGDLFTDNAFVSTSTLKTLDPALVEHFSTKLSKFIMFKITIPKGKGRGAYIAPYALDKYVKQCEFLLGRGSQLKLNPNITKVSRSEYVPGATETIKNSYLVEARLEGFQRRDVTTLDVVNKSIKTEQVQKPIPDALDRMIGRKTDFEIVSEKEYVRRQSDSSYRTIKC